MKKLNNQVSGYKANKIIIKKENKLCKINKLDYYLINLFKNIKNYFYLIKNNGK